MDQPVDSGDVLKRVTGIERDLEQLREGLGLLGVKRCSWCKKFFRSSEPAALFDDGAELVCYGCIHEWWPHTCGGLELKDRETMEHKLVRWLVTYHGARLIQQSHKLPDEQLQEFRIAAECDQCEGTGMLLGSHCRYCGGEGTMWVVIAKNAGQ
jgi:hypothetical protein